MKNFILIALALISVSGFSQDLSFEGSSGAKNSSYDLNSRIIELNQKALAFGIPEAEFNAIKGDAYANPKFRAGNIYQDDKLLRSNVPMRYNAYADEIEIKNDDLQKKESVGALMKDPSIYVKILKDNYVFIPYRGSNEKGGYFNILFKGKEYDLYKKVSATFNEPITANSNYYNDSPASFSKNIIYYLVHDGRFFELPSNKSKVLKVMEEKKNEVNTFIKENRPDLDNEADLIKLVSYFDSLLQ